jgi:hypothetical protein
MEKITRIIEIDNIEGISFEKNIHFNARIKNQKMK